MKTLTTTHMKHIDSTFSKTSSDYLSKGAISGLYIIAFFSSLSISLTQIGLGIVLIFWMGIMLKKKKIIFASSPLSKPIIFYLLALIISSIFGINILNSLYEVTNLWLTLIFFSMITLIPDLKTVKRLVYTMFSGVAIASAYGILQRILGGLDIVRPEGHKIVQYAYLQFPNEVLSIGFFTHHLTFAEVLLFSILLSSSLLLRSSISLKREELLINSKALGFYLFIFSITGTAIFFSFARGSWIGLISGFFFLLLFIQRKLALRISLLIIIATTLTSIFYLPIRNRIASTLHQTDRLYIWKTAFDIIADHPLTGLGPDNWQEGAPPYFNYYIDNKIYKFGDMAVTQHAHNNLIHQFAVNGFIGFATFIYIWIILFREAFHLYGKISEDQWWPKAIIIGGLGGILSFHIAGLFEATYSDSEVVMLHWFVTGIIFCAGKFSNDKIRN